LAFFIPYLGSVACVFDKHSVVSIRLSFELDTHESLCSKSVFL
jgi:hypothetical protein